MAKAHWRYECLPCGYVRNSVDEFGAYEAQQKHQKNLLHALTPITDALNSIGAVFAKAAQAFQPDYALAPPQLPANPSLGAVYADRFTKGRYIRITGIDYAQDKAEAVVVNSPLDKDWVDAPFDIPLETLSPENTYGYRRVS